MSIDKNNENNTKAIPLKVFLYNKKERYDNEINNDLRLKAVQSLIKSIIDSEPQMLERRKNMLASILFPQMEKQFP